MVCALVRLFFRARSALRREPPRGPVAAGLVAALTTVPTLAAGASPSARLVYTRTAEASSCPDEPALRSAVTARFGYDPFFAWAKQTVVVQLSRARGRYVAHVQIVDERGMANGARELTSTQKDCSEIIDATALAISIALDAASNAVPASAPPPAEPQPSPASPPPVPPSAPPVTPTAEPPAAHTPPPAEGVRVAVGAEVLGAVGTVPSPAPGVSAFVRAGRHPWSIAVELRADASESAGRPVELGGGSVEAHLYAAALVPCYHVGRIVACAVGMGGSLQASGSGVSPAHSGATPFMAAGARLGLEWPLSARFALRARLDGVVNLYPATLALGQDGQYIAWPAPRFAGTLGVGGVMLFP